MGEQIVVDYLVVGAGPAGLQLGQHLRSAGRDYLIAEAGDTPGTFFRTFPRHRTMISNNKPHTGYTDPELKLRMDWNSLLSDNPDLVFTRYTERYFPPADEYVRYLADYAKACELRISYDTRIAGIRRQDGGGFTASDQHGNSYRAARVVVATGFSAGYLPDVPGMDLVERYQTVSVEPRDFLDQRVLILGKGNSAFETAENLIETTAVIHVAGPHSVNLSWRTHFVGHLRAVNNNFLDTYQLKAQNAILDGDVLDIRRDGDGYLVRFSFSRANDVVKEIRYDRVIACTGFRLDTSIFHPGSAPDLAIRNRFPEQTSAWESVNVPDLYFAGTLMQQRDFKHSTNGFIHGFRYAVLALSRILDSRYHERPWPALELPADPRRLTDAVLTRVNRSSALWQQFEVMGDLLVLGEDGTVRYLEEVPVEYAREAGHRECFVVTLEYGKDHALVDPFDITVGRVAQDAADRAKDARYLHPVVRHHRDGELVAEHHLAENLENEWDRPQAHHEPLVAFLSARLGATPVEVGG